VRKKGEKGNKLKREKAREKIEKERVKWYVGVKKTEKLSEREE